VGRDTSGFAHLYRAAISRNKIVQQRLAALSDDYCDGASVPLMLTLLQSQRFTESEIEAFRRLIDELEKQNPSEHSGNKRHSKKRHRRKE
jgi:predicted transcriptional regulator